MQNRFALPEMLHMGCKGLPVEFSLPRPRIERLSLNDFRTYRALDIAPKRALVALAGENGAGKTNILEALSLFVPGRGLRRADFCDMIRHGSPGPHAVSIAVETPFGDHRLGTGIDVQEGKATRVCRIDGANVPSASKFCEYLRIIWLTPDLDSLFRGAAGDRRRFLDRLVLAVDPEHGSRVSALERALRSRNRLLEDISPNGAWLDAVEREIAEIGIAVASARRETVERLRALIETEHESFAPFPFAVISLTGDIDDLVAAMPAVDAEDRYRTLLGSNRTRDRAAGRTLIGPQASDLMVRHGPKDIPAHIASTGEQKALLIGLILAQARLVALMNGSPPLVLLDEIAAHLDPARRSALYSALNRLGGQIWMTGADPALFADLRGEADIYRVAPGTIEAMD